MMIVMIVMKMIIETRRVVDEVRLRIRKLRLEHVVRHRQLRPGTEAARRWMLVRGRHWELGVGLARSSLDQGDLELWRLSLRRSSMAIPSFRRFRSPRTYITSRSPKRRFGILRASREVLLPAVAGIYKLKLYGI